jgi:predicted dehydrogenase
MSTSPVSNDSTPAQPEKPTRRGFLKTSTAAALGGVMLGQLSAARSAHAAGSDVLKVGLIGCGGRGSGAAANSLNADPNIKLVAMADTFEDRLAGSLKSIAAQYGDRVDVPKERQFVGFDAYKGLLETDCDIVLLGTSPHFRPLHLKAALEAGKHVFAEKPVCVDAPGYQSILESVALAQQKNLSIVSGLCWRYDYAVRETMKRVQDGAIGDIIAIREMYNTRGLWHNGHDPKWSDMEYQMRNWLYYTWLSGDHGAEQHIHSLDKGAWILGDISPSSAFGLGGRQTRVDPKYGHIFDHLAVCYEFPNGVPMFAYCRQQDGCSVETSDTFYGTKGTASILDFTISVKDEPKWKYRGPTPNMYDVEHQEMVQGIRSGNIINNGHYMANSSMIAILGRMACYSGQTITWDEAVNSKENLSPKAYEWGPLETPAVAMPGITPFV